MSDSERTQLWTAVAREVTVPVIAGSTSNDTAHSVELTRMATEAGAAGILAVTPYYNRPSQAGIAAHFAAVAAATPLPVLIYDIPVRTGRKVAIDTMLQLARDCPNIVGVKDASGDPAGAAKLWREPARVRVLQRRRLAHAPAAGGGRGRCRERCLALGRHGVRGDDQALPGR